MTELSPEARKLLREAQSALKPDDAAIRAAHELLRARILANPAPALDAPLSGLLRGWLGKAGVSVVALVAAGSIARVVWSSQPPERVAVVAPAPPSPPPSEPAVVSAEAPQPEPIVRAPPQPSATSPSRARRRVAPAPPPPSPQLPAASVGTPDDLVRENELIRAATAANDRGKPQLALQLLNEHERGFPRGVLQQERLALRVLALCALNRVADARTTLRQLRTLAPASPHLTTLEHACR